MESTDVHGSRNLYHRIQHFKKHAAVAPEQAAIAHAKGDIEKAGYDCTENIIRLPWDRPVPYALLEKLIDFNLRDKADCTTFWRK
jgi:uncharacterized protein YdhG (YjbR/CyaY superfamily)